MNPIRIGLLLLLFGSVGLVSAQRAGGPQKPYPCTTLSCLSSHKLDGGYVHCHCDGRNLLIQILDPQELRRRPELQIGVNAFPVTLSSRLLGSGPAFVVTQDVRLQHLTRLGFVIEQVYAERNGELTVVIGPSTVQ